MIDTYLLVFKVADHFQVIDVSAKTEEEAKKKCFLLYPEYQKRSLDKVQKV